MTSRDVTRKRLDQIVSSVSKKSTSLSSIDLPFVGLEHIDQGSLLIKGTGNLANVQSQVSLFKSGDILYGKLRPYFRKSTIARFDGGCSTEILVLRPKNGFSTGFAFALISSSYFSELATSISTGTGLPRSQWNSLKTLTFEIPSPEVCEIIGDIAYNINSLRYMYEKSISTIQELTESLFNSWFVDFDPVKSKAVGKLPHGMDEKIAALFPDSFEDSELGPIPKGWRIQYLADICDIQRGFSYTSDSLCEQSEGMAMINLASFVEGGGYKDKGLKHVSGGFGDKFYIMPGDVLIATVDLTPELRVVGSPLIPPSYLENESIFSQDLLRLRNKTGENIGRGFLFHWLKIRRGILKQWSSGTTVSRFPPNALSKYPILIPPKEILQHFENIFEHTQEYSELSKQKQTNLSLVRDSLLPRLMSGDL